MCPDGKPEDCRSNYWLNVVLLKDRWAQQEFLEYTNDHGIMTRPVWQLMNRLEMFRNVRRTGWKIRSGWKRG